MATYLSVSVWPLGVGYFTLYRPLIGGTVVGLILGDVQRGMAFGAALNAVYLGFISVGGSLPFDLAVSGYVGTALALRSGLDVDAALAAFGVPLGALGSLLWFVRMTLGSALVHWADALAARGSVRGVAAVNLWAGQGLLLAIYVLPVFLLVYYGQLAADWVVAFEGADALSVVGGMLPAVGIGLLLCSIGKWRLVPYFIVGFVLATYFGLPITVIALLGVVAAWPMIGDIASRPGDGTRSKRGELPRRILYGAWWRWLMFLHAGYNYERLQGLGFAHAMAPVIAHLYKTTAERAAALRRHLVFFNSEPQFGALVPAAVIAMEEERAAGAEIDDEAINAVKSGLMGPLAGMGDSLIQGLVTPLFLSLGIGLAQQGSLAGPILYSLLISVVIVGTSYGFWTLGYRWGREAVTRILADGRLKAVGEGAAVVGMMVVGGLTSTTVHLSLSATVAVGQMTVSLQEVLDQVMHGLLPLALTGLTWWLLTRRVTAARVIVVLFAVGVDMAYLGLAGDSPPPIFTARWVAFLLGSDTPTLASTLAHLWPPLLATAWLAWTASRRRGDR